jgi:hypothetical protein
MGTKPNANDPAVDPPSRVSQSGPFEIDDLEGCPQKSAASAEHRVYNHA